MGPKRNKNKGKQEAEMASEEGKKEENVELNEVGAEVEEIKETE